MAANNEGWFVYFWGIPNFSCAPQVFRPDMSQQAVNIGILNT
jgi:hypothetical protein